MFNHTLISLILEVQHVKSMKGLRPIGLCTIFYKIIAKILTSIMQPIMPLIISGVQSTFTKKRLISDNILLCHEIMHHLKNKHRSKNYSMALKLDISKAYECGEWNYLHHVMQKFGFHFTWIRWIMSCITSTSYTFQLNGHRDGVFHPSRGLMQRDLLFSLKERKHEKHKYRSLKFKIFNLASHASYKIYFYLFDFNDKQHIKSLLIYF